MHRTAVAAVLLSLAAASPAAAWQQPARIAVAVLATETTDGSADLAERLTRALVATAELTGQFALYDTTLTRKATLGPGSKRLVPRLPVRYLCTSRISRGAPGWAQATIAFVDGPLKDPVVTLGSPVLVASEESFVLLAKDAWERLGKLERRGTGRRGP